MGMNVNLTPQLEDLVRRKVASGMYTTASEVVRAALRLMEEQDQLRAARLAQLRNDIQEGLDSGASEPWDPEATKRLARAALLPRRGWGGLIARVLRRPRAAEDIAAVWDFIADVNPDAADHWRCLARTTHRPATREGVASDAKVDRPSPVGHLRHPNFSSSGCRVTPGS
jgi:antitoxin ParD1/3/4